GGAAHHREIHRPPRVLGLGQGDGAADHLQVHKVDLTEVLADGVGDVGELVVGGGDPIGTSAGELDGAEDRWRGLELEHRHALRPEVGHDRVVVVGGHVDAARLDAHVEG